MTFRGRDRFPALSEKATALGFSIIRNHPSLDGNQRIGRAAMELLLFLNGQETQASVDDEERVILQPASGDMGREKFTACSRPICIPWCSHEATVHEAVNADTQPCRA
jgi:death-on-curing protein